MRHEESDKWEQGDLKVSFYEEQLIEVQKHKEHEESLLKVVKSHQMPWEDSPQGRIKHLLNEKMGTRMKSVEAYMQIIPPGSSSGKHRHMGEELVYILEGKGYDLHWDVEMILTERYEWKIADQPTRYEWEEGDLVYIPPNTVHQHFNVDSKHPARFISSWSPVYRSLGFDDLEQIEDAPGFGSR
ncbi:MAG: cupin domain-containing protein [Deltaproteobacteria bacterium]|nr:MAG: cupin domain-containing protein [Deltaproteobacteria bacterium]